MAAFIDVRRIAVVCMAVLLLLIAAPVSRAHAEAIFTVYLSASGSDSNDGLTAATAVKTLTRAQAVLVTHAPAVDVEIRIKQGTYVAPQTNWTFYVPGRTITFMPIDYQYGGDYSSIAGRPVFRSDGTAGWWFSGRLPSGHPGGDTNLRFSYLQVEGYSTGGLTVNGGVRTNSLGVRVPATTGANRNTVYGMLFQKLGSKHSSAGYGYGGVDLVNSSDNVIRNNHFLYNENAGSQSGLIHGVYLAHWSKRNIVAANRFYMISGGPMRTRNDSNDNDVYSNTFERAGVGAYYSEWFCDTDCVANNPGSPRECASHGNLFHDNNLVSGYSGGDLSTWALTPPGIDYAGGEGCDNEGQKRLRTWGNA